VNTIVVPTDVVVQTGKEDWVSYMPHPKRRK